MLCEKCGKRHANVHQTHITTAPDSSRVTTKHDFCEVCAGKKTEEQWQADQIAREEQLKAQRERNKVDREALMAAIKGQIYDQSAAQAGRFRSFGCSLDPGWRLCLLLVGSKLPDADAMEALLGQEGKGQTHAVRHVLDWEVHFVRWDADPARLMERIFALFPEARPRLDLSERLLFVEGELDLFSNSYRSLSFCQRAASALSLASAHTGQRVEYRFKSQKETRLADAQNAQSVALPTGATPYVLTEVWNFWGARGPGPEQGSV